jgi:hypothetical protein
VKYENRRNALCGKRVDRHGEKSLVLKRPQRIPTVHLGHGATLHMPLNFTLERILCRFGGGEDGTYLQEVEHTEAVHRPGARRSRAGTA